MVKDKNYLVIQGWMITKLKLKGTGLLLYALIYGFSQDAESGFAGSLQYLQDWTNSTRQGVINALKTLLKDGLIVKEQGFPFNTYYVKKETIDEDCKQNLPSCKQSLQTSKKSLHNNIDIDKDINKDNNISVTPTIDFNEKNSYIETKEQDSLIAQIVTHLNKVCGTHFRANASGTKRFIKARLKEGFKLQDFIDVIDYKWKEWGENPKTFSGGQSSITYLRPSTLFGTKMEEYLQQAWMTEYKNNKKAEVASVEASKDRSDKVF